MRGNILRAACAATVVRTNPGSTYTHGVLLPDRGPATGSRGQPPGTSLPVRAGVRDC
jgi:hypothetical protein